MTVTAEDTLTRYAADGVTTTYAAGFYVESEDQLSVYFNDDLVSTSDWSYSEGFITFTTAPLIGAVVCIQRNTDLSRPTSYQNNTNSFVPKTLDQDVDRTWLAIQELATKFKSVLSLPISDSASPATVLAELRAWLEAAKNLATDQALPQLAGLSLAVDLLSAGVSGEQYARALADTALQTNISAEEAARTADVATLNLALAAVGGGSKSYLTLADLTAVTPAPAVNTLAYVSNDSTSSNNGMYTYSGSAWVKSVYDPLTQSIAAINVEVANRKLIIDGQTQFDGLIFTNALGFVLFSIDQLSGAAASSRAEFGTVAPTAIEFAQSQIIGSTSAELEVINSLGFAVFSTESQSSSAASSDIAINANTLLVSPDLIAWSGERIGVHVAQLVADRVTAVKQRTLTASLLSNSPSNAFNDTSNVVLDYKPKNSTTTSATVHVYDSVSQQNTSATISRCATAPLGSSTAIKVLMIGDSITNRGGADCVRSSLIAHGYTPTMLGTITGTAFDSASPTSEGGYPSEGREGSQIQHHLYVYVSRAAVVVGDEAAYLALSKVDKQNRNPFVRLATGGDNAAYVFNSYIFDMRFYLNRFSLPDPDVVYINLGTNDITAFDATTSPTLATAIDRIKIMIAQTRTALPSAGIVIALPSPAIDGGTLNTRWTDKYTAAIAQLKTTIATLADSKVYLCPEWAVMSATAGYAYSGTTVSDGIHPLTTGRVIKYDIAAAYIAAAKAGV